jgi:hypothetical protein
MFDRLFKLLLAILLTIAVCASDIHGSKMRTKYVMKSTK